MPTPAKPPRVVSLLTDFGLKDEYVGVMKGVILQHCPTVQIVDISHGIRPQDIHSAARTVLASHPFFPRDTIHLVVVDPGVGSRRSILLVQAAHQFFIAPDNGVLTPILASGSLQHCYFLKKTIESGVSSTFHGRDLMAPLAGKLAADIDIMEDCREVDVHDCQRIDLCRASVTADSAIGEVTGIDHFGNLATSIAEKDMIRLGSDIKITVAGVTIGGLSSTYSDTAEQELIALIDSRGFLEIARNCGSAADTLCCSIGDKVIVRAHTLE